MLIEHARLFGIPAAFGAAPPGPGHWAATASLVCWMPPAALLAQGVALSAVATIIGNTGLNMQKWGFILEARKVRADGRIRDC